MSGRFGLAADAAGDETRYGGCVIRETGRNGGVVFTVFGPKGSSGGRSYLADFSTLNSAKGWIDGRKS